MWLRQSTMSYLVYFVFVCYSAVTGLGWDKDGDILAVITDKSHIIFMWDANTQRTFQVDSSLRYEMVLVRM